MIIFTKAHPATQAMSRAAAPADLNEGETRRNPGEPSPEQAETGRYNKPRIEWRGLTIAIENPAGSVRRGANRHGVSWEIRMRYDYGEVVGSMGVDGDPVDIYLGPHLDDAPMVYVVHQRRVNDWANYDEDKVMAGFLSEEDAAQAFLSNYNDPRFLGPITAMPVDEFVAKVRATSSGPAMIKALFLKTHVDTYTRKDGTVVAAHEDKRAAAKKGAASASSVHVTETPQFNRWFGDSKVVDSNGKPLVVYHESGSDFDEFDPNRLGSNTGYGDAEIGFHFADNHADADHYASMAASKATGDHMASGVVRKFYLSLQNPLIVGMDEDDGNAGDRTQEFLDDKNAAKSYAEENGHDGIIYLYGTNVDSGYTAIAFSPEQIKSATDNNNDFDPESRNIRKSLIPVVLFFKGFIGPYLRGGKMVNLKGYHSKKTKHVTASEGQSSLFADLAPPPEVKQTAKVARALTTWMDRHGGPAGMARLLADMSPEHQGKLVDAMAKIGKTDVATVRGMLQAPPAPATQSEPDLFSEPQHTEPTRELIEEHERLVDVLNSPSHEDDKVEAKKQAAELEEMKQEVAKPDRKILFIKPSASADSNPASSNLSNNSPEETAKENSMKPLNDDQRTKIARGQAAWEAWKATQPDGATRAEFKEAARAGKLDHLYAVQMDADAQHEAEVKASKKAKNDAWRDRNVPKLAAAKQAREEKWRAETQAKWSDPNGPRTYLRVPFSDKDSAKAAGARWDADKRQWYHTHAETPDALKPFVPRAVAKPATDERPAVPAKPAPKSADSDLPTTGVVSEDDPSIYGSWLLGREGEPWAKVRKFGPI